MISCSTINIVRKTILSLGVIFSTCASAQEVTLVLLPDTQTYAQKYPEILTSQIDWVLDNADTIDLVLQQGDLTQNNSAEEWQVVQSAFYKLNDLVPYVLAVGNHDMGSAPGKFADTRNTTLFNTYFPYENMAQLPGFGGVFKEGKLDNAYYLLESDGCKLIVLTLEFGPRDEVLHWANDIVSKYPDRTVIINTHSYMYSDSTRQGGSDHWRPQAYDLAKLEGNSVNDGEQIWQKLVKKYQNIRFVFSGHVLKSGVGTLISINDFGFPVYQFLANYQEGVKGSVNGGNGYLRILNLDMQKNTLKVQTYSPYVDEYKREEGQDFTIKHMILQDKPDNTTNYDH